MLQRLCVITASEVNLTDISVDFGTVSVVNAAQLKCSLHQGDNFSIGDKVCACKFLNSFFYKLNHFSSTSTTKPSFLVCDGFDCIASVFV